MTRSFSLIRLLTAALILAFGADHALAQQGQVKTLDQKQIEEAFALFNQQKYPEAAALYESLPKNFPTSLYIPEATFRLGYIEFLMGNYDKAVELLQKVPTLKNVDPALKEPALALVPQVLVAKAAKMKADDPARKAAFASAVKQFEVFLKQYPNSDEAESATYYMAMALYQGGAYLEAANALRGSLQKFAKSPTILDTQYLLALTLGTLATSTAQTNPKDPSVESGYAEAEKLLLDIYNRKEDIALLNDAVFQIAELAFAHSGVVKDPKQKDALLNHALDYYRGVAPKDAVLQAQALRIANFKTQFTEAGKRGDLDQMRRYQRIAEKEQEKLASFKERVDETLLAKLKMGQVYFQLARYDETRVVLDFVKAFVTDEEQKKQVAYYTTLSYAVQQFDPRKTIHPEAAKAADAKLAEKTVAAYNDFRTAYPKDDMGENLALLVGGRFIDSDPEKAISYFKQSVEDYPNGRFKFQALAQQASALVNLKRFDEALSIFKTTLAASKDADVSAAASFGIATVLRDTGKSDEAVKAFKEVRDKHPDTVEGSRAAYFVGQTLYDKGDTKGAVTELQNYVKKFPDGDYAAEATFYIGEGQLTLGKKAEGLATLKDVATKFPQAEVSPYTFFERAKVAGDTDHNYDECNKIMRDFISAYPNHAMVFDAYDFMAKIQESDNKPAAAVEIYEEFVKSKPEDANAPKALFRAATIWKGITTKMLRYNALSEDKRTEWKGDIDKAVETAERVVNGYPDSPQVALALALLLDCQKARDQAKLISDPDVEKYFQDLAKKFDGKPSTKSKIVFTLASYTFEKDQKKAIGQMAGSYDPALKYAPNDLDLYGEALIREHKLDEAWKIYEKLGNDYPVPKGTDPTKASREIQDAQAMMLFGEGKILQEKKKSAESKQKFDQLKQLYPWSPKMLEANFGIASSLAEEKKYDDALKLLIGVARATQAAPELRAKAMLLLAKINESQGDADAAINNYIKVEAYFSSALPELSAEGLWHGAQLLEKQATGQIPMPNPAAKSGNTAKQ